MSIKTLRRTKLGRLTSLPISEVHYGQHPSLKTFVGNLMPEHVVNTASSSIESARQGIEDLAIVASRARKSADPAIPLSFMDKVREFIHFNSPNVNMGAITDILSKVKTPLIVTLGIAFAAGLAFLAYKVYQNRDKIPMAINKIIEDIKASVPDLMQVQGWAESIRKEVTDTMHKYADSPAKLISKITKIKDTLINHQGTINPVNIGSGINMIAKPRKRSAHRNPRKKRRVGAGVKVPM